MTGSLPAKTGEGLRQARSEITTAALVRFRFIVPRTLGRKKCRPLDRPSEDPASMARTDRRASVLVEAHNLAAGAGAERLEDQARRCIARCTVRVGPQIVGDAPEEVHRAIAEEDIRASGVEARWVVEPAITWLAAANNSPQGALPSRPADTPANRIPWRRCARRSYP
jgi:hypothetical protein